MNRLRTITRAQKLEFLMVALLLLVAGITHGWNMFGFPYYENDEGTYMSQAWAVLELGELAPYTYWYDHAPAGWLLIALYTKLTGGFFAWGFSINTGRVLMLLLHLGSTLLLYIFAKRITGSKTVGIVAALIFALTPLGIAYRRRVLLDNIMTFWVLAAFCLVAAKQSRLRYAVSSALIMGLAVLTKEPAVFFIPGCLLLIWHQFDRKNRKMTATVWSVLVILVVAIYPLYALLKNEFFPSGTFLGGDYPHVSLLETLAFQLGREDDNQALQFVWWNWVRPDPVIMILGGLATVINLLIGIKSKSARIVSLVALPYIAYLLRGGIIIVFYISPLLPFLALNIAYTLWRLSVYLQMYVSPARKRLAATAAFAIFALCAFSCVYWTNNTFVASAKDLYTLQPTRAQTQAADWLLRRVENGSNVLIDNYAYVDLNANAAVTSNYDYTSNFDYYWKADTDPEVQVELLEEDYRNVDILMETSQVRHDTNVSPEEFPIVKGALDNFEMRRSFEEDGYYVNILVNKVARENRDLSTLPKAEAEKAN